MGDYFEKLKDPRWQKVRLKVFERDNFRCLCCEDSTETLHVHHLIYSKGEPWDAPLETLETLCATCHGFREEFNTLGGRRTMAPTSLCYAIIRFACHAFPKKKLEPKLYGKAFALFWDYVGPMKKGEVAAVKALSNGDEATFEEIAARP